MKLIAVLFCVLISSQSFAVDIGSYFVRSQKPKSISSVYTKTNFFVGHSLTQTSYTLPEGKWMLGTFALGYGLTDDVTLGTSPWLLTLYNMPNVVLRMKKALSTSTAIGAHTGYMKTQEYLQNFYKMEAFYGNLIFSHVFSKNLRTHIQLNAMYFKDDEKPFSIRVENPTTPVQISLSAVNEIIAYKKASIEYGLGLEVGVLGMNEELPYYHGGLSVYRKVKDLFIQVGLSVSATTNVSTSDFQYVSQGNLPSGDEFREIMTHPEIQIQYYF